MQRELRVLEARASVLEREFGFGVVRQLLPEAPPPTGEGLFAVLDGLFRHTAELAAQRPLVLCIDDLQWSDTASLRFVAYLARRISSLPVLVKLTLPSEQVALHPLYQPAKVVTYTLI